MGMPSSGWSACRSMIFRPPQVRRALVSSARFSHSGVAFCKKGDRRGVEPARAATFVSKTAPRRHVCGLQSRSRRPASARLASRMLSAFGPMPCRAASSARGYPASWPRDVIPALARARAAGALMLGSDSSRDMASTLLPSHGAFGRVERPDPFVTRRGDARQE
jgi:hypothetical protein